MEVLGETAVPFLVSSSTIALVRIDPYSIISDLSSKLNRSVELFRLFLTSSVSVTVLDLGWSECRLFSFTLCFINLSGSSSKMPSRIEFRLLSELPSLSASLLRRPSFNFSNYLNRISLGSSFSSSSSFLFNVSYSLTLSLTSSFESDKSSSNSYTTISGSFRLGAIDIRPPI